ncbi:hypothetical protein D9M68_843980 [compost metagenome]
MSAGRPMISGSSNCSSVISSTRISGARMPGSSTRSVTLRKVTNGEAPEAALASSSEGFIERSVEVSSRNTKGTEARACAMMRPGMPKTLSGPLSPSMPRSERSITLTQPELGPASEIHAMPSTCVGTSSGKRINGNQPSRPGRSVRSISQASAKATTKTTATVPATKTRVFGMMVSYSTGLL